VIRGADQARTAPTIDTGMAVWTTRFSTNRHGRADSPTQRGCACSNGFDGGGLVSKPLLESQLDGDDDPPQGVIHECEEGGWPTVTQPSGLRWSCCEYRSPAKTRITTVGSTDDPRQIVHDAVIKAAEIRGQTALVATRHVRRVCVDDGGQHRANKNPRRFVERPSASRRVARKVPLMSFLSALSDTRMSRTSGPKPDSNCRLR
jgi:hypothetical protein